MKKRIFIIGIIVMFLSVGIIYCCVSQTSKYVSYVTEATNDGMIKKVDKKWWGFAVDDSVEKEKKVNIRGKQYVISYENSGYDWCEHNRVDKYSNKDVDVELYSKDASLKEIHYRSLLSTEYYAMEDIKDSYNYALKKAKEIASEYIDVQNYQMEEKVREIENRNDDKLTLYTFHFKKPKEKFESTDDLYIQITSKGDLRTLSIGNIGAFDEVDVSKINLDEVEKSIKRRLDGIYNKDLKVKSYTYEVERQILAYSPEGELVIASALGVHVISESGNEFDTGVTMATVIEE